jgi:O-glycosyl hydrolase
MIALTIATLTFLGGLAPVTAQITVKTGSTLQMVDGFGFSQAFGRAKEFQNTPAALQKQALEYLFNNETGAGFSIIRNRVGSGGAGDSILPTSPGSSSGSPKYAWDDDDSGQVWFSKQAMSYGVSTIYADAWSAPGFMKTSGNEASAGYLCGTSKEIFPEFYQSVTIGAQLSRKYQPKASSVAAVPLFPLSGR